MLLSTASITNRRLSYMAVYLTVSYIRSAVTIVTIVLYDVKTFVLQTAEGPTSA